MKKQGGRQATFKIHLDWFLYKSLLFLDKLSSTNSGETGRGDRHSIAMLLVGTAEGQVVLSSREQMNAGKVDL